MALSTIAITEASKPGPRCTVCITLAQLPKPDAEQLEAWLADPAITLKAINKAVQDDPDTPNLGYTAIQRHVRGECAAGKQYR